MAFARLASRLGLVGGAAAHRYAHLRAARLLMDAVPKAAADPSDMVFFAGERGEGRKKNGHPPQSIGFFPANLGETRQRLMRLMRKGLKKLKKRIDIYRYFLI